MKFLGIISLLIVCASAYEANTRGIADDINEIITVVESYLKEHDPVHLEKFSKSLTFLGYAISIEGDSLDVSGFSNEKATLNYDASAGTVTANLDVGEISISASNLAVSIGDFTVTIKTLSRTLEGLTLEASGTVDDSTSRLTTLTALLQLGNIKGTSTIDVSGLELDFDTDLTEQIKEINNFLKENQEKLSQIAMVVVNAALCALY